jgi:uncharacterized protein (DUF302 family)
MKIKPVFHVVLGGLLALFSFTATAADQGDCAQSKVPPMLVEHLSPLGFEETLTQLEENAKALGWKVPSKWKVDFQRNLKKVTGTDIGRNSVLKMCAPDAAVPLLVKDEFKMLSALMPCTIAVYEKSDGKTYIAMMNLRVMGMMYGEEVADMAERLAPQMDKMLEFK